MNKHLPIIKKTFKKSHKIVKGPFWFLVGFIIAGLTISSIAIVITQSIYKDVAIPGVFIEDIDVGNKTESEIEHIFNSKTEMFNDSKFTFKYEELVATTSAKELNIGYNSKLIAKQAVGLGKSNNIFTSIYIFLAAYTKGIKLDSSYTFDEDELSKLLSPLWAKAKKDPINAQFIVKDNRVTTFKQSTDGIELDLKKTSDYVKKSYSEYLKQSSKRNFVYNIPPIITRPEITTEQANSFGIVEEIGKGTSLFQHSIPNRIHNVNLAATKINGILVKPGEEFSFVKNLGDVSKATGYQSAYVIQNGRTVLGDGGGVCQVSTTLFRAILNAGLPITERHAHAYRVSYYEQESSPGLDATVYYPSVDLKFVNDTNNYILIQSEIDLSNLRLTYTLYGKKDGRSVTITDPYVFGFAPAPEPLRQDDPTLPSGTVKQVDFPAAGASVTFKRTVIKEKKTIIDETFKSRYTPWRAVFLVGTG